MSITFGTDGWRAVIGDDFTYANLELVTRATARWLLDSNPNPSVVLGHDTRFQGRAFSEYAARVFGSLGVRVILASRVAPTPAISWGALGYKQDAGIVITASHNPPSYSGFKIKASFGGPATPEQIDEVEAHLDSAGADSYELRTLADLMQDGTVEERDVTGDYLDVLRERIDTRAIRASGLKIAHDAMYGAGAGLVGDLIGHENVVSLHDAFNPGMMDQAPEPIERNLGELSETIVREGCAAGLANDGDADRIGMYDETGTFVDSHQLLALLVNYLHDRGETGSVVKTFSTTRMLDKMGERYGLPVETTKIGFKYIASKIVEGDVLVGGEESGGMAVKGHIPERDGIYIGLLVVEMMVTSGKKLSELVQELFDAFGAHRNARVDVHTTHERKAAVLERLSGGGLGEIDGRSVEEVQTLDGFKHLMGDRWLLVRPSGTEPVLRVYAEAPTEDEARAVIADAMRQLDLEA
jgi:phosphomannomutase